jgi:hypothetical protein
MQVSGVPLTRLDRNGVGLHYDVHGDGPAAILSHGYSASIDQPETFNCKVAAVLDSLA